MFDKLQVQVESPHDPQMTAEVKAHTQKFGGFNDKPPGWCEIPEQEFAQGMFFSYGFEKQEYRQLSVAPERAEDGSPLIGARLFFFHDGTGVALMNDHRAGKVRYFKFAVCEHTYREVHGAEALKLGFGFAGNCCHAYVCDKCGAKKFVDSSD